MKVFYRFNPVLLLYLLNAVVCLHAVCKAHLKFYAG